MQDRELRSPRMGASAQGEAEHRNERTAQVRE
jgi:hypothetical protein